MGDMTDWRPEGWEQTKAQLVEGWDGSERNLGCLVEDTATAMLEALKARGKRMDCRNCRTRFDYWHTHRADNCAANCSVWSEQHGHLVFIPEVQP